MMNEQQLLAAQHAFEEEDDIYASIDDALHKHNDEWSAKWPKHCKTCGGWGMLSHYQSVPYGATSASFEVRDECDALPVSTCHRCGAEGLNVYHGEAMGPCSNCGWNFDDGLADV